jgi:hypothetical protein
VIPGWILFEAAPAKLAHYTLPVHGGIVLLGAIGLMAGAWDKAWVRWIGIGFVAFGGLILAAAPVALAQDIAPSASGRALWYSAIIAMFVVTALILIWRKAPMAPPHLAFTAIIVSIMIKGVFVPSLPELNVSARVSQALVDVGLHPRLSADKPGPLIGFGYQEPSLIFATRSDSALSSVDSATRHARVGAGVVVARESLGQLNTALAPLGMIVTPTPAPDVIGTNYSKGDPVTLMIGQVANLPQQ